MRPGSPDAEAANPGAHRLLAVQRLVKRFPIRKPGAGVAGWLSRRSSWLHAVDDVSLSIGPGETVGLVGESGCGKSTLVRLVARLMDADEGTIDFDGRDLRQTPAGRFARDPARRDVQVVFQDSHESLNPRYTAADTIAESIRLLTGQRDPQKVAAEVREVAREVGLPAELLGRFPHQLSGGQKARVNIARAIAVRPRLLILDEPTAALDVSVQAIVLRLLDELRARRGMAYLFVSHDLNVVRLMCDRVVVMYLGRVVESGPAEQVFARPAHPYTALLVSSLPSPGRSGPPPEPPAGEPGSPIDPDPRRCRYAARCPKAAPRCVDAAPQLARVADGHEVACHFPLRSA